MPSYIWWELEVMPCGKIADFLPPSPKDATQVICVMFICWLFRFFPVYLRCPCKRATIPSTSFARSASGFNRREVNLWQRRTQCALLRVSHLLQVRPCPSLPAVKQQKPLLVLPFLIERRTAGSNLKTTRHPAPGCFLLPSYKDISFFIKSLVTYQVTFLQKK